MPPGSRIRINKLESMPNLRLEQDSVPLTLRDTLPGKLLGQHGTCPCHLSISHFNSPIHLVRYDGSFSTYRCQTDKVDHAIYQSINLNVHFLVPFLFDGIEVLRGVLLERGLLATSELACPWK